MIPLGLRNIEIMYEVSEATWLAIIMACQELSLLKNGKFDFDHFFKTASTQDVGKEFNAALDVIDRLGNDKGYEALRAAGETLGVDVKFLTGLKVRDAAAQMWLLSRKDTGLKAVLDTAHVKAEAKTDRQYKDYVGKNDGPKAKSPKLAAVKQELQDVLDKFQQRKNFQIIPHEDITGQLHYYIVRPDTAKRLITFPEDRPVMLDIKSGTGDQISYDPQTNRLRISTRSARLMDMYRAAWGRLLADDSQYFSDHNICTLEPLHKHGQRLFSMHSVQSITSVQVFELHWGRGDTDKITLRVKSCFCWKSDGGKRGFGWVMAALCAWQNRFSFADEVQQAA